MILLFVEFFLLCDPDRFFYWYLCNKNASENIGSSIFQNAIMFACHTKIEDLFWMCLWYILKQTNVNIPQTIFNFLLSINLSVTLVVISILLYIINPNPAGNKGD